MLDADQICRTVLISVHDGSAATLEEAQAVQAATGIVIVADGSVCCSMNGQAALLTAVATAVRAFGSVRVVMELADAILLAGMRRGSALGSVVEAEGAQIVSPLGAVTDAEKRPVLLLGPSAVAPDWAAGSARILRARWVAWSATVEPASVPSVVSLAPGSDCVLASIAAAALGVSEAFQSQLAHPGSDAGYRAVSLNLWAPGTFEDGPPLLHAPAQWWLVGLGHLGQAYSWVISWLNYAEPERVEVVLQDTDKTTIANYSTGVLTPSGSRNVMKTRLIAAALGTIGYETRIVERRLEGDVKISAADVHVALIGVDNLGTRRAISNVGWKLAIDAGLGAGAADFSSMLLRRFPGSTLSTKVAGWSDPVEVEMPVPDTPAFCDLSERMDRCGLVTLAGKAVGAAFVGIVAATLAVAEAVRELHGGRGLDVALLNLDSFETRLAAAANESDVVSLPLKTLGGVADLSAEASQ